MRVSSPLPSLNLWIHINVAGTYQSIWSFQPALDHCPFTNSPSDGRLGLSCRKDVRAFARYLRREAATKPANTTCYHGFTWYTDTSGTPVLLLSYLSIASGVRDQPWRRGDRAKPEVGTGHDASCLLSELGGHLEWFFNFRIRDAQVEQRKSLEELRRKRKEIYRAKILELQEQEKREELEYASKLKSMENAHQWQLAEDGEEEEEGEEEPAAPAREEATTTAQKEKPQGGGATRGRISVAPAEKTVSTRARAAAPVAPTEGTQRRGAAKGRTSVAAVADMTGSEGGAGSA